MTTRTFHLGDILSITTRRLVSPRHVHALYDLLNFMTGDNLLTHQIPRAMQECGPDLLRQFPDLAEVDVPERFEGKAHVERWLAEQVVRFGETRTVRPLAAQDHTRTHPLTELRMMRPDMPETAVEIDDEDQP